MKSYIRFATHALLLACCLWTAAAWGQQRAGADGGALQLGEQRSYVPLSGVARAFVDRASHATPDPLEATGESPSWQPFLSDRGYRIDGVTLWVRFDARTLPGHKWFLEVGSSGVDRAQLFYRGPDGRWVVAEAGDVRAVSDWPVPGRLPTFELSGATDKPVRYWLRIEHDRLDFASPLRLYQEQALLASRDGAQFLLGGYFSLAAVIAMVSLINAAVFRDRNFGVYALYVATLAAGQLAYLGVGAQYVWDRWLRWNEMAGFVLPGISAAALLWFVRTVTEPARYSRALDVAVWGVIAALLSVVAMEAAVGSRSSLFLVVLFMSIALVTAAILIGFVWRQGDDPDLHLLALGLLPVLVMAVFPLARGFNLVPVSALTRYSVPVGAALEMPILFYALSVRSTRRREMQVRAAALSRTDPLTGLAHSRMLVQRLESALARSASQKHACALLAVKVANLDAAIAEFGRETGDRMLVVAASLLRQVAADIDTPARVGEQHFALLLEGPATAPEATGRAQRLVAAGLRPTQGLPPALVLKLQVAVALLPDGSRGAEATLRWVLDAVSTMRPDEPKLIRPLNF